MKKFFLLLTMIAGILIIFSGCPLFDNISTSSSSAKVIVENDHAGRDYTAIYDNTTYYVADSYGSTVTISISWSDNYSKSVTVYIWDGYYGTSPRLVGSRSFNLMDNDTGYIYIYDNNY